MKPVKSSFLASIDYDEETSTLIVAFRSGALYTYDGVPPEEYHKLMGAESVGRYFQGYIKPIYPATLVPLPATSRPTELAAGGR